MTQDHFLVYQFMASKFGGLSFDYLQELSKAVAAGSATKRFVPIKAWAMYTLIAKSYSLMVIYTSLYECLLLQSPNGSFGSKGDSMRTRMLNF